MTKGTMELSFFSSLFLIKELFYMCLEMKKTSKESAKDEPQI